MQTVQTMKPESHALIASGPHRGALVKRIRSGCDCGKKWPRVRPIGYVALGGAGSEIGPSETGVHPETAVVPVRMR